MAEEEVLTQEEIDELLHTVGEEEDSQPELARVDSEATPFDFALQARVFRDHLPTLEVIHDKIARGLRVAIQDWLKRGTEVAAQPMRAVKYAAYSRSLALPTAMQRCDAKGLTAPVLLCVPAPLAAAVVDGFFGGRGHAGGPAEAREFSRTERRIVEMLLALARNEAATAWAPVCELGLSPVAFDSSPQFVDHHAPDEPMLIHSYGVQLDCGAGEIHLVYPWRALEPLRETLAGGGPQPEQADRAAWNRELQRDLVAAKVTLTAGFSEAVITVQDLMSLAPGDFIPIDLPDQIIVSGEGVPLFRAGYGTQDGRYAVQVHDLLQL